MTAKTMRLTVAALAACTLVAAHAAPARAQTNRTHVGLNVVYNFDYEEFGAGGQMTFPIGQMLQFYPSFNVYFVDGGSLWAANADLKYAVSGENLNWLYLGGGLNVTTASAGGGSDSNAGLNLFAGVESLRGNVHPFLEVRFTVGDGSSGQLAAGLNFTLGRHQ